jgi:outer membrane receptor protein involved in Fe transport
MSYFELFVHFIHDHKLCAMMRYKQGLIILSLLFSIVVKASPAPDAERGKLTGRVVEEEQNQPLEFATISVYSPDSVLVTGGVTSADGTFSVDLERGKYYALIRFISYDDAFIEDINISGTHNVYNAGTITLSSHSKELNTVEVTADKSEMVINLDKKVFNVGKDLSNTGKTALDILDNIPSVQVDLDGNISLRGSENLQILIDGKPSGLVSAGKTDALQNLQGSMIDRIEVVTNPSARYEAEGMAGIINIVLKKDQQKGLNGSFEATVGYPENYSLGANVNFRREKFNYFVNYNIRYFKNPGYGSSYQHFMYPDTSYITRLERERTRSGLSNQLRGGFDYFINPTNTITASFLGSYENQSNRTRTIYRDYTNEEILKYYTERIDQEDETEPNFEASVNYEKKFAKDEHKLTALFQYEYDNDDEKSAINQIKDTVVNNTAEAFDKYPIDTLLQRSDNNENERNYLLQADYSYPFGDHGKFEAGYRGELRNISNPYSVDSLDLQGQWIPLLGFTNNFEYNEYVHAIYLQAGNNFKNLSIQLGLRAEYSDVRTKLIETNIKSTTSYLDFFPTLHSTYKFNDINSVQLSYSRRIQRPDFRMLNPFHSYSDARNIRTGNPFLKPEYTNSFEAGYLLKRPVINLYAGAYYRGTSDVVERITIDSSGINYMLPINLNERKSFGFESNLTANFGKWWTLSGDYNFYRSITKGEFQGESKNSDDYAWNIRMNSRMRFAKNIDFQTIFFYRAPEETTQGLRKAFYMLNMAVSKDLFKNKGTITLNVQDVLNSRRFRYVLDIPTEYSENEFRWSKRSYTLTFIYRLNQKKKINRDNHGNGGFGGEEMDF